MRRSFLALATTAAVALTLGTAPAHAFFKKVDAIPSEGTKAFIEDSMKQVGAHGLVTAAALDTLGKVLSTKGGFAKTTITTSYPHEISADFQPVYGNDCITGRLKIEQPRSRGFRGATFSFSGELCPSVFSGTWKTKDMRAKGGLAIFEDKPAPAPAPAAPKKTSKAKAPTGPEEVDLDSLLGESEDVDLGAELTE